MEHHLANIFCATEADALLSLGKDHSCIANLHRILIIFIGAMAKEWLVKLVTGQSKYSEPAIAIRIGTVQIIIQYLVHCIRSHFGDGNLCFCGKTSAVIYLDCESHCLLACPSPVLSHMIRVSDYYIKF